MKKFLTLLFAGSALAVAAQENPFEEFGYKPKIATLSGGKYIEYFDRDTIVQIGSLVYNTKSKKVIGFVEEDTTNSEATLQPDIVSRWISPDPLFSEYPSWSPYTYVMNNPIQFIDPDGREVYIHGADASKAVAALQMKTSLQLIYDVKTGMLSAVGNPESTLDKELLGAINDQGIKVNLYTTKENAFQSRDGSIQPILIGGYDGSEVENGVVKTTQYINMGHSEKAEAAEVSNQGSDVFHEAIESYYGGQNDPGGIYDQKKWEESHNKALAADPSAPELSRNLNTATGQTGLINPDNGKSVDLRPMTSDEKKATGTK